MKVGTSELSNLALQRKLLTIDLTSVKLRAMKEHGWDAAQAEAVAELYLGYLYLCGAEPTTRQVPPKLVDEMWHLHILDTRKYRSDCQNLFGGFLDHAPALGENADETARMRADGLTTYSKLAGLGLDINVLAGEMATCSNPSRIDGFEMATCSNPSRIDSLEMATCSNPSRIDGSEIVPSSDLPVPPGANLGNLNATVSAHC